MLTVIVKTLKISKYKLTNDVLNVSEKNIIIEIS